MRWIGVPWGRPGCADLWDASDLLGNRFDGHPLRCSARCSSTMRTARSRISSENFGYFFMAPFSRGGASAKLGVLQV